MSDKTCPHCHRELPAEASFCLGCGTDVRLGLAEDDRPTVDPDATSPGDAEHARPCCSSCGVFAPRERKTCEWCETPLDTSVDVPLERDDIYPVAVRCQFQCRSCGHMSPLNQLDLDGTVRCLRCGLEQVFDVGSWTGALHHAHAVGDLAGPAPEGLHPHPRVSIAGDNPLASIGRYRTSARLSQTGTSIEDGMVVPRSLRIDAAPGHPLCPSCSDPLELGAARGTLIAACARCQRTATYDVDPRASRICPGLAGVLAEDQRSDRPEVRVADVGASDASVLRCPGCGAALTGADDAPSVTCEFCKTVARIPGRLRLQLFDHAPETETWWLLFRGRSHHREELEECADLDEDAIHGIESPPMVKAPLPFRLILGFMIPLIALIATFVLLWGTRIPGWLR